MEKKVRLIQSIQRAFDIINCFDERDNKLSLPQISERLSLNINTVRGITNTLVANGYLIHEADENLYSLGLVYIPKAELVTSTDLERIKKLARPYLEEMAEKFHVSARFQIITNNTVFSVDNANPERAHYVLITRLNTSFPLNATASGKLVLAHMGETQREHYFKNMSGHSYTQYTKTAPMDVKKELDFYEENGYTTEFEESGLGVTAIAVPILKPNGSLYGTVSIMATSSIVLPIIEEALPSLKECAQIIQENLYPSM